MYVNVVHTEQKTVLLNALMNFYKLCFLTDASFLGFFSLPFFAHTYSNKIHIHIHVCVCMHIFFALPLFLYLFYFYVCVCVCVCIIYFVALCTCVSAHCLSVCVCVCVSDELCLVSLSYHKSRICLFSCIKNRKSDNGLHRCFALDCRRRVSATSSAARVYLIDT